MWRKTRSSRAPASRVPKRRTTTTLREAGATGKVPSGERPSRAGASASPTPAGPVAVSLARSDNGLRETSQSSIEAPTLKTLPARTATVAPAAAALLACSSKPIPLQVTALATTITSPNPGVLTFWTDLDVYNPNAFPLSVVNVQSDLTLAEINEI